MNESARFLQNCGIRVQLDSNSTEFQDQIYFSNCVLLPPGSGDFVSQSSSQQGGKPASKLVSRQASKSASQQASKQPASKPASKPSQPASNALPGNKSSNLFHACQALSRLVLFKARSPGRMGGKGFNLEHMENAEMAIRKINSP